MKSEGVSPLGGNNNTETAPGALLEWREAVLLLVAAGVPPTTLDAEGRAAPNWPRPLEGSPLTERAPQVVDDLRWLRLVQQFASWDFDDRRRRVVPPAVASHVQTELEKRVQDAAGRARPEAANLAVRLLGRIAERLSGGEVDASEAMQLADDDLGAVPTKLTAREARACLSSKAIPPWDGSDERGESYLVPTRVVFARAEVDALVTDAARVELPTLVDLRIGLAIPAFVDAHAGAAHLRAAMVAPDRWPDLCWRWSDARDVLMVANKDDERTWRGQLFAGQRVATRFDRRGLAGQLRRRAIELYMQAENVRALCEPVPRVGRKAATNGGWRADAAKVWSSLGASTAPKDVHAAMAHLPGYSMNGAVLVRPDGGTLSVHTIQNLARTLRSGSEPKK